MEGRYNTRSPGEDKKESEETGKLDFSRSNNIIIIFLVRFTSLICHKI